MAIRAKVYESNRQIASTPGVRLEGDFGAAAFGGGAKANELPRAVVNFANAIDDFGTKLFKVGIEEREDLLASEVLKDALQYKQDITQKTLELEEKYPGENAPQAILEMTKFAKDRQTQLMSRYGNSEFAQRALLHKLSPISAGGVEWAGEYARKQKLSIMQTTEDLANAQFEAEMPGMSLDEYQQHKLRRNGEQALTVFKGNQAAIKEYNLKADAIYFGGKAKTSPGELIDTLGDGDLAAIHESGTAGIRAVGRDEKGGYSYGTYQMSSAQETMAGLAKWAEGNGKPELARAVSEVKDWNTPKGGEAWNGIVDAGLITQADEKQYMMDSHFMPAFAKLPEPLRASIENNPVLQSVMFSTVVQHGAGGGAAILNRALEASGGDVRKFVNSLYDDRKTKFPSSTPEVRASVQKRLEKEKQQALAQLELPAGQREMLLAEARNNLMAQQEKELKAQKETLFQGLSDQVSGLPRNEQAVFFNRRLAESGASPEVQAEMGKRFEGVIKQLDDQEAGEASLVTTKIVNEGLLRGATLDEMQREVDSYLDENNIQKAGRDASATLLAGGGEAQSDAGLRELYIMINEGKFSGDGAEQMIALEGSKKKVNATNVKKAIDLYNAGGKDGLVQLKYKDFESAYRVMKNDSRANMPTEFFDAIRQYVKPDSTLSSGEITKIVSDLLVPGVMYGPDGETESGPRYEGVNEFGESGIFLADVPDKEKERLAASLANELGREPTNKEVLMAHNWEQENITAKNSARLDEYLAEDDSWTIGPLASDLMRRGR